MKQLFTLLMLAGVFTLSSVNLYAQESADEATETATTDTVAVEEAPVEEAPVQAVVEEIVEPEEESEATYHQIVKEQFIDGGPSFMGIVLLCLILGLAVAIERIIHLNLATTNVKKLLSSVESSLSSGGVEAAKEVCKNTRGPVASIFVQGMMRMSEGIEMVEKSIIAYGSVEMGKLERGMVWISLFISLAPMLGFMGTVIGMISAFDAIAEAGDVSPSLVAGGIKVALLTTVAGLIVAVILQLFYNYLVSKIDSLVNSMEDASISLVDILVKHNLSSK
ncbi:MAG: biopolymer transport protein ExbB [Marinoscillum sp.]|jgi:biopolymer transport protein ExbB